jgi:hypothetical protein
MGFKYGIDNLSKLCITYVMDLSMELRIYLSYVFMS